jgi:hypothetical protein
VKNWKGGVPTSLVDLRAPDNHAEYGVRPAAALVHACFADTTIPLPSRHEVEHILGTLRLFHYQQDSTVQYCFQGKKQPV